MRVFVGVRVWSRSRPTPRLRRVTKGDEGRRGAQHHMTAGSSQPDRAGASTRRWTCKHDAAGLRPPGLRVLQDALAHGHHSLRAQPQMRGETARAAAGFRRPRAQAQQRSQVPRLSASCASHPGLPASWHWCWCWCHPPFCIHALALVLAWSPRPSAPSMLAVAYHHHRRLPSSSHIVAPPRLPGFPWDSDTLEPHLPTLDPSSSSSMGPPPAAAAHP